MAIFEGPTIGVETPAGYCPRSFQWQVKGYRREPSYNHVTTGQSANSASQGRVRARETDQVCWAAPMFAVDWEVTRATYAWMPDMFRECIASRASGKMCHRVWDRQRSSKRSVGRRPSNWQMLSITGHRYRNHTNVYLARFVSDCNWWFNLFLMFI